MTSKVLKTKITIGYNIQQSNLSQKETPKDKSIVMTMVEIQDDFVLILHKYDLHEAFRTSAGTLRFINNCRKNKKSGPLTTVELR